MIYLEVLPLKNEMLALLGEVLDGGIRPVHTRLYFNGYMTQLTNIAPVDGVEIVGLGDGYTIQLSKTNLPLDVISIQYDNFQVLEKAVREFGDYRYGLLDSSDSDIREWYDTCQGYGSFDYSVSQTSNTYISSILHNIGIHIPKPHEGAIGWGVNPKFPGLKLEE